MGGFFCRSVLFEKYLFNRFVCDISIASPARQGWVFVYLVVGLTRVHREQSHPTTQPPKGPGHPLKEFSAYCRLVGVSVCGFSCSSPSSTGTQKVCSVLFCPFLDESVLGFGLWVGWWGRCLSATKQKEHIYGDIPRLSRSQICCECEL